MPDSGGHSVRVCLIGELRVERGQDVLRGVDLGSRKGRTVLAVLAARVNESVSALSLAEPLWPGGAPDTAESTVASLVSRLRRQLGAEVITGGRAGYRIGMPPTVDVDLAAAHRLVEEAERRGAAGEPGLAAAAGHAAISLLDSGRALDAFADDAWVSALRTDHHVLLRRARHAVIRAANATGDHRGAQRVAAAAVAADPLDEEAARELITALAAVGESGAALNAYERLRRELAEQLGASPAPATQALHADVLRGEPTVVAPTTTRAAAAARPALFRLAGREREMAVLDGMWAEAAAGRGALVLLAGGPGAGKTRLAEELTGVARDTGGAVLTARCYEAERGLIVQPLVEAISSAAAVWPAEVIRVAASQHLHALARLVPEIRAVTGEPSPQRGRADVEHRRTIEAVSAFLGGLAAARPVLLVLDDLHNAGQSTVELLHFLRTQLPTQRLLVVGTVRDTEGADVLATLAPVSRCVDVGALPAAAVELLATAAGQMQHATEIARRTAGHALFVVEILRGLGTGSAVPESLQAAVLDRVEAVGDQGRTILRAAAVLGAEFDPRLAAALAGHTPQEALRSCEQSLEAGLLIAAGPRYEFANDVLREVVYATTPEPTRHALHALAIDLLTDRPEQVAEHAHAIEDWTRAARAWLRAAEGAVDRFAAADAADLAGRAFDAAHRCGSRELEGRALVVRGRAGYAMRRYQAAWTDLGEAIEAAREAGDRRLEMTAQRLQAHDVHVALGRPPADSEGPLRTCLAIAESLGDRASEANTLNRLAILATSRLDFVRALELGEQSLRAGRATGQRRPVIYGLDALKAAYTYLGEVDRVAAIVTELEPLERADGDLMLLQWAVFESLVVPLARGDHAGALARIEAALAINRRSGYQAFEPFFVAHLGWVHRLAGDLAVAADVGGHAVATGREHRHAWWLASASAMYAATLLAQGRDAEAARELELVLPSVDVAGAESYRLRCLGTLAACGSHDALSAAEELLATITAPPGGAWLLGADAYFGVARAWTARGKPGRAREVLEPLRAAARRVGWPTLVRLADESVN